MGARHHAWNVAEDNGYLKPRPHGSQRRAELVKPTVQSGDPARILRRTNVQERAVAQREHVPEFLVAAPHC
ncbi:hypothetical protein AB4Y86_09525 [Arthrobacter sp. 2YAF22_2]|uniref:hypothetical protein n=1 Tax=Arthrobacter sp. 2YAF22_2 TaxID=3233029 RepID=UPI003F91F65E